MSKIRSRTTPLSPTEIETWFEAHLPYLRVSLTNHIRLTTNQSLFGNMSIEERGRVTICTYEIGVLTCRKFIEFLGMSVRGNQLVEKRNYHQDEDGNSYEVKVTDLGGQWVSLVNLSNHEKDILRRIYLTGHRATVHLTDGSPYQGEWEIFNEAVTLVDDLLKKNLYNVVGRQPTIK